MHLTILCSQFHYFASRSLKRKAFLFCVPTTVNSYLLVEGDMIMQIIFLHFIDFTYNNGERNTEILRSCYRPTQTCRETREQVCCRWFELPFVLTEIPSQIASKHLMYLKSDFSCYSESRKVVFL